MNESHGHGSRIAAVVFGFLLAGAALLWLLFWLFGLAWFWPPELGTAVFLGVCVGLGIVALLVGVFCMVGRFPGHRGWLVAGAAALAPVGVLAAIGLSTSRHASDVDAAAARAVAERTGSSNVKADCVWELDEQDAELWRCDISSAKVDRCFVWVTERGSAPLGAVVDRCHGDEATVADRVRGEYRQLRGVVKTADFCLQQTSPMSAGEEIWRCDLTPAGDDGYCYATVAWGRAGNVRVAISHCERELSAAFESAYMRRGGRLVDRARCTEDDQNEGDWICELGASADSDRCFVAFASHARRRMTARIFYCQQEVVTGVDAVVERMYEKRTRFDDVTAACRLEEHEQWDCEIRLPDSRDRCDVWIVRRAAGPRVEMKLTTCASGRV